MPPVARAAAAVERRVPRLALVPRDQLHASASADSSSHSEERTRRLPAREKVQRHQEPLKRRHELSDELAHASAEPEDGPDEASGPAGQGRDGEGTLEADPAIDAGLHQLRLGERFLRMMTTMARLSRWPLEAHGEDTGAAQSTLAPPHRANRESQVASSPTGALQKIAAKKEVLPAQKLSPHKPTANAASPAKGAAAPLLIPTNVATEPLRQHLTFEISMLLPQPIDTRQSSLQSPIRRKNLLRRRRRRRRRLRREKRTWMTSHTTWVPHASAAYIEEHSAKNGDDVSKLMAKFAQLKSASSSSTLSKSQSMSALDNRTFLYAFPKKAVAPCAARAHEQHGSSDSESPSCSDSEDENEADGLECDLADSERAETETDEKQISTSENHRDETRASGDNKPPFSSPSLPTHGSEAASHTYPHETPRSSPQADAVDTTAAYFLTTQKRPLFHRPALISPELNAWLIDSGMFQTRRRPVLQPHHSTPTIS